MLLMLYKLSLQILGTIYLLYIPGYFSMQLYKKKCQTASYIDQQYMYPYYLFIYYIN